MKNLLKKIWDYVKGLYEALIGTSEKYVPIAIRIVEGVKKVVESPVDDVVAAILKTAIPGTTDDVVIDKVKIIIENWLPKIALELRIINSINGIDDPNEQLKAILNEIRKLSVKGKWINYHDFAVMIIDLLADGRWTWADSVQLAEYTFQKLDQNKEL